MIRLERLTDGNYRLTLEVHMEDISIFKTWTFAETDSDAEPVEGGADSFRFELKLDK